MLFDLSAIFFDEAWPANYVDGAMLIFQRDEDRAIRRTRSLRTVTIPHARASWRSANPISTSLVTKRRSVNLHPQESFP